MTPSTSPPANDEVVFARTNICDGGALRRQWAAVTTVVGETTEPVHRPLPILIETVEGSEPGAAAPPPTTLADADGAPWAGAAKT